MRLLTATREAQGELPGDFRHTVEGELVLPDDVICARDRGSPLPPGPVERERARTGAVLALRRSTGAHQAARAASSCWRLRRTFLPPVLIR